MTKAKKDAKYFHCDTIPVVGQKIYIRGAMYMSHGEDDYAGGRATITAVKEGISGGEPCLMVSVKEIPGHSYNWTFLEQEQAKLAEQYKDSRAHPDPDTRPEFNCWISPGDSVTETYISPQTGEYVTRKRIATKYEK